MERKKLRIALVSDAYYPHVGGIQEHIYHLGIELKKRGHYVKVITGSSGDNSAPEKLDVIRIGKVFQFPANKSFSKATIGFGIVRKIRRVLEKERFDIVHVHGALVPFLPIYSHVLFDGTNIHTFHAAFESSLGYDMFKKLLIKIMERIDGMVAVSETAKRSITKYLPGNYTIIPNGIDTQRFSPTNNKLTKFKNFSPLILFVGRFEPRKGLKYLFLSFNEIIKALPKAGLIVVGEGRLKNYYKSFLDKNVLNNVFFEGKVSMGKLPKYFSTCDIFCSPAYTGESFGIILLEALASGKPTVASNIPGYKTVIRNGYNGILVSPKHPEEITEGVLKIIRDEKFRKMLIKHGLNWVKKYSWQSVSRMVESFYYETMDRKTEHKNIKQ